MTNALEVPVFGILGIGGTVIQQLWLSQHVQYLAAAARQVLIQNINKGTLCLSAYAET